MVGSTGSTVGCLTSFWPIPQFYITGLVEVLVPVEQAFTGRSHPVFKTLVLMKHWAAFYFSKCVICEMNFSLQAWQLVIICCLVWMSCLNTFLIRSRYEVIPQPRFWLVSFFVDHTRFLGYFQPQEGKSALWELDSDYYLHVSGTGDEFILDRR